MPRETPEEKLRRMTALEDELLAKGLVVAGIDEVGRGPLAGPVVAACISIPKDLWIPGVDDSKKLTEKRREALSEELLARASYVRFGEVSAREIDRINILQATKRAMEAAAAGLPGAVFLIDAVDGIDLPGEHLSIIGGDAQRYMIAAASIVAKVYRDRMMRALHERYPAFGFDRNKGYGTPEHIRALRQYGPIEEHRRSFIGRLIGAVDA
jgi:ribonuclease HII